MRSEIRDLYLIMLGMGRLTEFQGTYETWPRGPDEYLYKGNVINYKGVLEFLDEIYSDREKREKKLETMHEQKRDQSYL